MRIFLLPAFDGTGLMFSAFAQALGGDFQVVPIAYPEQGAQDYAALAEYISQQLPKNEDYAVLGESFAGPLVYRLAVRDPVHCKAAIFVATYLTNPRPLFLRFLTRLPAKLAWRFVSTPFIVRILALSWKAEASVAQAIARNFGSVPANIIKQRLGTIASVNEMPVQRLSMPCLYLKAARDRLVLKNKLPDFKALCDSLVVRWAEGGHFVLQENSQETAEIVARFLRDTVVVRQ